MNLVFDYQSNSYTEVPEEKVTQGIQDGIYSLPGDTPVDLIDSAGQKVTVSPEEAITWLKDPFSGFKYYSNEQRMADEAEAHATTTSQQAIAAGEGLARGLTLGLSDIATTELGITDKESIKARKEYNPGLAGVGEVVGTIAPLVASGGSSVFAKGLSKAGSAVLLTEKAGLTVGKNAAAVASKFLGKKSASFAKYGAEFGTEGFIYGALNELNEQHLGDSGYNAEAILWNGAKNSLVAGATGSVLGSSGEKTLRGIRKGYDAVDAKIAGFKTKVSEQRTLKIGGKGHKAASVKQFKGISDDEFIKYKPSKSGDGTYEYTGKMDSYFYEDRLKEIAEKQGIRLFDMNDPRIVSDFESIFGQGIVKGLKEGKVKRLADKIKNPELKKKLSHFINKSGGFKIGDEYFLSPKTVNLFPDNVLVTARHGLITTKEIDNYLSLIEASPKNYKKLNFRRKSNIKDFLKKIHDEKYGNSPGREIMTEFIRSKRGRFEYIDKEARFLQEEAIINMNAVVETLNSSMISKKRSTNITYQDMADFIRYKLKREYKLRPKDISTVEAINEAKFLEENIAILEDLDKVVGGRTLTPLELRAESIKNRRTGNDLEFGTKGYSKLSKRYYRDIGKKYESQVGDLVDNVKNGLNKTERDAYKKARNDYGTSIDVLDINGNALAKEMAKQPGISLNFKNLGSFSAGYYAGGPVGAAISGVVGSKINAAWAYYKARFTDDLYKKGSSLLKKIDLSAEGFVTNSMRGVKLAAIDQFSDSDLEIMGNIKDEEPEKVMNDFYENNGEFLEFAPIMSGELINKFTSLRNHVSTNIPKQTDIMRNPEVFRAPAYEDRKAKTIYNLSANPDLILKQISKGFVTKEGADILKNVYPKVHQVLYEKIMENVQDSYFSPKQKMEMKKLFGGSMDASLRITGFTTLQTLHQEIEKEAAPETTTSKRPFKKRRLGETTDAERRSLR